jgi:hypothetical protein
MSFFLRDWKVILLVQHPSILPPFTKVFIHLLSHLIHDSLQSYHDVIFLVFLCFHCIGKLTRRPCQFYAVIDHVVSSGLVL